VPSSFRSSEPGAAGRPSRRGHPYSIDSGQFGEYPFGGEADSDQLESRHGTGESARGVVGR
jgi:hypothetical protein